MKTKKNLIWLVVSLLVISIVLAGCSNNAGSSGEGGNKSEENWQLSIGTASMGGAFFPVGQEIANLVTKYVDGAKMTPEVTAGALENPRLIANGDVELGITNANLAYFAANGMKPYEGKLEVSAVSLLHPSVFHIITMADSPINSIADLKGKKIAVGPAGGGTLPILQALLEQYGLSMDDIVPNYLSYNDGFTQLSDGNVDVALALSGYPASAVVEISTSKDIKFIEIADDKLDNILAKYSYYSKVKVPKDVYKLKGDATAIGVPNVLLVNNNLDEQLVYNITKAIFDNLDEFKEANANAKQIDIETADQTPIPLHPGAKKYFDERK
ncbi:MAG TPA: TAXI family TRAP transporter solute-binding subunit [Thermoanaerobacterales bacterium]|nr:TAXI family TRAP transporter solute-binding subunit [Thermoanaerobacterales bacterium]